MLHGIQTRPIPGLHQLIERRRPRCLDHREARQAVWDSVRAQADRGGAVLLSTHYLAEAEALADRVVQVDRGVVVAEGTVAELKASKGLTVVRFRARPGVVVDGAAREGAFVSLVTRDGAATVDRLSRAGIVLCDLEVRPLSLEEALTRGASFR